MFVSEFGFPMKLKLHASMFVKMDGDMTLRADPALMKSNRPGLDLSEANITLNMNPR